MYVIGAIYDTDDIQANTAFRYAVTVYNSKAKKRESFEISPLVETTEVKDNYQLATKSTYAFKSLITYYF